MPVLAPNHLSYSRRLPYGKIRVVQQEKQDFQTQLLDYYLKTQQDGFSSS